MGNMLTLDQIAEVQDVEVKEVEVPEWGGTLLFKKWSGMDRDRWDESVQKRVAIPDPENFDPDDMSLRVKMAMNMDKKGMKVEILVLTIVDDKGNHYLDTGKGRAVLSTKSAEVLERLATVAMEFQGVNQQAEEQAVKN